MNDYPFIRHLEELRRRIILCLITVIIASLTVYPFVNKILFYLTKPLERVIFTRPVEAFIVYIKLAIFGGLILSIPLILYQTWAFAGPGLKPNERRYVLFLIPLALVLFLAGGVFAYLVIIPLGLKFLLGFGSAWLVPMITVGSYISFFCIMTLAFGCVFELPAVILLLSKLGLVTPQILRKNRKYVILAIFVTAAVITPPDVFTQIMIAVPLMLLYELGIYISYWACRDRIRANGNTGLK